MTLWPFRRLVLVVALLLLILAAAGLLTLRVALDPEAVRRAAETRLSAMLGQPVTIAGLHVSLLPVPALVGAGILVGPEREAPDLALQRIRIVPRLGSLLRRAYVIREVTLEGLTVRVVREPPGRWKFPPVMPIPGRDAASQVVVERVRLRGGRVRVWELSARDGMHETSSIDDLEGEAVADAGGLRISPIHGRVGGAAIAGEAVLDAQAARIDFSMAAIKEGDLGAVLGLAAADPPASIRLTSSAAASMSIRIDRQTFRLSGTGSVRAPDITVESLRLHGLEAPIKTDGVKLTFDPTTFTMYGGTHHGTVTIDLSKTPARWSLDGRVSGIDVSDFLKDFTGRDQRLDGTASAAPALRGIIGEPIPRTLDGRMQVDVVNGVIREFPLLTAINRALRLAEGDARDTRFERLSATLMFEARAGRSSAGALAPGHATTEDLVMQARDVRVEAAGRIGFDRSLDLAGQAVLSPEKTAGAIRSVRELSGLRNDRGELELPLTITGTVDTPSIRIDLKTAVGRSIKEELRRRLRGWIRD
jgi:uncharacterized protein involved in outer membrane biogenesis